MPAPAPNPASDPAPTIDHALQQACRAGLPLGEARMLLLHLLGRATHDRAWLLAHGGDALPPGLAQRMHAASARRLAGEPVAYLTGEKAFYGLRLHVDARVLDPREDTEALVDWALALLRGMPGAPEALDLGTGSGAIALALCHQLPHARITATDASADALDVARANARRLGLHATFRHGHWFDALRPDHAGQPAVRFDLIASNPPYIAQGDAHLHALRHEPPAALVSGAHGLDDLRHIAAHAPAHLRHGGWLLLEHGWQQGRDVRALLAQAGFARIETRRDLAGHERCTGGQWLPAAGQGT